MYKRRMIRVLSYLFYLLAAAFDFWVLHITLAAAGIRISPTGWWASLGLLYGVLSLAPWIARTAAGQLLGRGMSYAYSLHALLPWFAAGCLFPLAVLSYGGRTGTVLAGWIGLLVYTAGIAFALYGFAAARRLGCRRFSLTTEKVLPGGGLRIVHLSDLHFGFIQNERFTNRLVRRVNALQPDLVCITGDFFSDTMQTLQNPAAIAAALGRIRAKVGVFACLGNHDAVDPQARAAFFRTANVRVLADEAYFPAPNVAVIGRSDATPGGVRTRRPAASECMIGTDPLQYRIVLDHQPRGIGDAGQAGADLLLCGHTHGGQFFPVSPFVERQFPYCAGVYTTDSLTVAVSPGSGAGSPPLRIGSRGEIYLLTVRQSETGAV